MEENISKNFVIGIGGTGMRCLESFTHMCAMGLYDNMEFNVLTLDTDFTNAPVTRPVTLPKTLPTTRLPIAPLFTELTSPSIFAVLYSTDRVLPIVQPFFIT